MGEISYGARYDDLQDFAFDKMWEKIWSLDKAHVTTFGLETETPIDEIVWPGNPETLLTANDYAQHYVASLLKLSDHLYVAYRYRYKERRLWCRIAAESEEIVQETWLKILSQLATVEPKDHQVAVRFWHWGGNVPAYNTRRLEAPRWEDIKGNYAVDAQQELTQLMDLKPEGITGGRLAIIHGPPGTGKTTMLRALCQEWKKWCSIDYIIDPEAFFGNALYMTSTLTSGNDTESSPKSDANDIDIENIQNWLNDGKDGSPMPSPHTVMRSRVVPESAAPWRLLIIEDAEEFINPAAKEHVGQALSRLLNVGDGFIGQGLNILILMTTNVALTDMHPAIKRPGRCMVNIEVPSLSRQQATKWLGAPIPTNLQETTLAELYELQKKVHIGKERKSVDTGQYL